MSIHNDFINPLCQMKTLDNFGYRKAILISLQHQLAEFQGIVLDIGCGYMPYKSLLLSPPSRATHYIGIDLQGGLYQAYPDIFWDSQRMPFKNDSIDCTIATEVLEHCPSPETLMSETFRVLRPGGFWFFTVPFLWPLHDVPNDEYRYTPFSLKRLLRNAGFKNIKLQALGGWDASLAQMAGLWVRRRPMSSVKRTLLSFLFLPVIQYLLRRDELPEKFHESFMLTGMSGVATK